MAGIFKAEIRVAAKTIVPGTSGEENYTENVAILPANTYVIAKFGRVKTAFTGLTKPKVSLGVTGDVARYMVAQPIDNIYEFVMGKLLKNSAGINKSSAFLPNKYKKDLPHSMGFCEAMPKEMIKSSSLPIIATFTSSSTLFNPSAGEVEFVIVYVDTNAY